MPNAGHQWRRNRAGRLQRDRPPTRPPQGPPKTAWTSPHPHSEIGNPAVSDRPLTAAPRCSGRWEWHSAARPGHSLPGLSRTQPAPGWLIAAEQGGWNSDFPCPDHTFLADGRGDPCREFLQRLHDRLPDGGSIVVYDAPFELGRLKECCQLHQTFAAGRPGSRPGSWTC